jgi:hypothetical protein
MGGCHGNEFVETEYASGDRLAGSPVFGECFQYWYIVYARVKEDTFHPVSG